MKKSVLALALAFLAASTASAGIFNPAPKAFKWISPTEVIYTYDGSYTDSSAFSVNAVTGAKSFGVPAPEKYESFPVNPEGAVNLTYSPDSLKLAFTRDNDLYIIDIASGKETRLTADGSELILNGYASWVYYEEIFGRPSRYRAFWWSPDSGKIAFYRFDNSRVPMFPIYSPAGQDGSLSRTRYPKAGESNPEVRIGIIDLASPDKTVWADFDAADDQYFGIPFWGADSREFFVSREPRVQNTLDLYAVCAADGSRRAIYHEEYKTWLDWIEDAVFTEKGLYMVRDFDTGWQQIYFLSYDGMTLRRLTDGHNWRMQVLRVDEARGDVYFRANRDHDNKAALYKLDRKGRVTTLTDPSLNLLDVKFSPDGKYYAVRLSNYTTPDQWWVLGGKSPVLAADLKGEDYNASDFCLPQDIRINIGGLSVPGMIIYPKGFDPAKKYPVHMNIYGGPNTAYVKDSWANPSRYKWWTETGIIYLLADVRASGHNGRAGVDMIFKDLTSAPISDFVAWARYLKTLPYVDGEHIAVQGFSFGGTMTSLLMIDHSDDFCCGIAGGGVYDWALYDTHYTERFMLTPQLNPEGYRIARVLDHVDADTPKNLNLLLTHGTGDDNVHFQNTLQLVDAFQQNGVQFRLMIYPDGMHGYRGAQGRHSDEMDRQFLMEHLFPRRPARSKR